MTEVLTIAETGVEIAENDVTNVINDVTIEKNMRMLQKWT
jgi:hypothetical protein